MVNGWHGRWLIMFDHLQGSGVGVVQCAEGKRRHADIADCSNEASNRWSVRGNRGGSPDCQAVDLCWWPDDGKRVCALDVVFTCLPED